MRVAPLLFSHVTTHCCSFIKGKENLLFFKKICRGCITTIGVAHRPLGFVLVTGSHGCDGGFAPLS